MRSTTLSLALKQNNNKLALQKLSGLTVQKVLATREAWFDVERELTSKRKALEEYSDSKFQISDSKLTEEELASVVKGLEQDVKLLEEKLAKTVYLPLLCELKKQNEEELLDTLQLMIIDMVKYYHTSEKMNADQIYEAAYRVMNTFGGLTLEDVALCFHQVKSGEYGVVYNRVDGAVILDWLHKYKDKMQAVGMEIELQRHIQGKGATHKEGGQWRISEMKEKGIEYNPSLNLKPIKRFRDLME